MSGLDEVEYANLADQVRRIEELVNSGQAEGMDFLLKSFLSNAKSRMEAIRQDESTSEERKEQKSREAANVIQMVEMEHRLNAQEKEQYAGFLKLDYFTRANFDELDDFYGKAWDKLSEEGKSQMSHRVWEGIRHGEYTFAELPENVRKKESERLYEQLVAKEGVPAALANIPAQDRADFIREYEAGNDKAVAEVLNRESFSMNVSTTSSKEELLCSSSVSSRINVEDQQIREGNSRGTNDATEGLAVAGVVFADVSGVSKPVVIGAGTTPNIERS